ncbi:sodium-coupled neutral amino acid transporter 7 isoform X2 [Andrena cerasifolii]|uniref:sodium-coupled neutral amino acid transporter 7 isoform X2 n=1 Tax=Andrena cerasifolii TaxID=2819439 RepID=UPI00403838EF
MNCLTGETDRLINNDMLLCTAPNPSSFRARQTARSGTGALSTIFLIVNATLGAGLLNFPQAFDRAGGIATSVITQLVLLVFITATLVILANCSEITNTSSMQNMFAEFYGGKALILCALCVAIYSFGCCLTFIIIVGDQFDRVLATYYGYNYCHTWYLSRSIITAATCSIFILPLCFFKRLDVLSYASSVGCVTILYVVCLIVYKNFTKVESPIYPAKLWPDNNYEVLQIIPIICFAYQSHMTAIPLYACMKERSPGNFTVCAVLSMIICFAAYTVVGICGYATFGTGKVPSDILQGYTDKRLCLFRSTLLKDSELHLNKDRLLIIFAVFITALGAFVSGVVFVEALEDLNQPSANVPLVTGFRQLRENLCN